MKRLLDLRNRVAVALVFVGLLITASSFTIGSGEDAQLVGDPPPKKVQRVKVIVNKDGKETKIDTTFNLMDDKMVQEKVDSVLYQLDGEKFGPGDHGMAIHRGGKRIKCTVTDNFNGPDDENFDIFIQKGDTCKTKDIRKVIRLRGLKNGLNVEGMEGNDLIPPLPPIPSHGSFMFHNRMAADPYAFDTRDESVVSYEKKDIGDGLEKITIIRKKHGEHQPNKVTKVKGGLSEEKTETKGKSETKK